MPASRASTRICHAALRAGYEVIRAENASVSRDGRTELRSCSFLRAGDALVVTRIDRLARSLKDPQDIVHELRGQGGGVESDRSAGRHRHRRWQGVFGHARCLCRIRNQSPSRAPARGYQRRQEAWRLQGSQAVDAAEVTRLREEKLGPAVIARRLGIGQASVYRLLGQHNGTVSASGERDANQA